MKSSMKIKDFKHDNSQISLQYYKDHQVLTQHTRDNAMYLMMHGFIRKPLNSKVNIVLKF